MVREEKRICHVLLRAILLGAVHSILSLKALFFLNMAVQLKTNDLVI